MMASVQRDHTSGPGLEVPEMTSADESCSSLMMLQLSGSC